MTLVFSFSDCWSRIGHRLHFFMRHCDLEKEINQTYDRTAIIRHCDLA